MKILHTSDLQLDAPFAFLGDGGQRHRVQILETFEAILKLAEGEGYDLLLISGDLFDTNRPQQSTIDRVVNRLGKVSIPVCILPGNHDPYDSKSIYRRTIFPPNVTIFTDQLKVKGFPDLDLAVYGNAIVRKDSTEKPLEGISPSEPVRWHVAMAHGNMVTGLVKNPDRPITDLEIASCGMDYVALGDWHGYGNYSQGKVQAFYSGSPEPMAFDQTEAGYVASVILGNELVEVDRIRVGKIHAVRLELEVSGQSQVEIIDLIGEHASPETMLEVSLKGLNTLGNVLDPLAIEETLAPGTYAIRVRDQTHPELDMISPAEFPEEHVIGKFVEIMMDQIAEAQDEHERIKIEQALQLGIALLQGKGVI